MIGVIDGYMEHRNANITWTFRWSRNSEGLEERLSGASGNGIK
ncbi:MAG: hypothetical protein OXC66_14655 [Roseovarius sp.]|nr:hypothetical protein [Roseovarius sp.]